MIINNKKQNIICRGCGKKDHIYKKCISPITSWGIILIRYDSLIPPKHNNHINLTQNNNILIKNNMTTQNISDKIKFLLISRKYSVGYVEFIRGRYKCDKIEQVIYLFKQMTPNEIKHINYSLTIENGFDYLWDEFWGDTKLNYLIYNKTLSKTNYNILKNKDNNGPEFNLQYITEHVKSSYMNEEWGFPKGRINCDDETELQCALREFKEETGYTENDINIIHNIEPLVEIFNGTNGVLYKHIYYVAELITDKQPLNIVQQQNEIGNIQFMDYKSSLQCIRNYHVARKHLLHNLYLYYCDILSQSN